MADNSCFLGIDLNAFGLALVLLNTEGEAVGGLRRSFGEHAGPGEHDPQDWWRGVRTGVKELLRRSGRKATDIRAMSLSGMASGCVAIDAEGRVIFPALIGGSPTLDRYAENLRAAVGDRNLRNLTGCGKDLDGAAMAPKLLAIRETAPRVWHDLDKVFSPRDYVRYRLSDEAVTDPSMAARTLLFSPRNLGWSPQVLERIGLTTDQLPTMAWGNRITGRVSETAGRETGLTPGTPIITGASHQSAAALATGACAAGELIIELGSNGSVTCLVDQSKRDLSGLLDTGCFCLEGLWTLEHHRAASGEALTWLMRDILPNEVQSARRQRKLPLDHFCDLASRCEAGAGGLLFAPPLSNQAGALLGVGYHHGKSELIRGVMESAVLSAALVVDQCRSLDIPVTRASVTGPGAKTALWPQMLANALDLPVRAFDIEHLCARGMALLAASAITGSRDPYAIIPQRTPAHRVFDPEPDNTTVYVDMRQRLHAARNSLDLDA